MDPRFVLRTSSLAMCLALCATTGHALAGANVAIDEVAFSLRSHFRRIKSLDITYTEDRRPTDSFPNATGLESLRYPARNVCRLQIEGSKYRSETGLDGAQVHETLRDRVAYDISAFDLKKYQILDKRDLLLSVGSDQCDTSPFFNPPVLRPFFFVSTQGKTFDLFRDSAIWDNLKKTATVGSNSTVGGRDCVMLDVLTGPGLRYRVYCAKGLEYYPVRYEVYAPDGTKGTECTVTGLKEYETPEGTVVIPLVIEEAWLAPSGEKTVTYKWSIDEESLSVNEDIPDKVFTIPLSLAVSFEDRDDKGNTVLPHVILDDSIAEALADIDQPHVSGQPISVPGTPEDRSGVINVDSTGRVAGTALADDGSSGRRRWLITAVAAMAAVAVLTGAIGYHRRRRRRA